MWSIFKDYTFSAAHFIPGHKGGCERMHGHNYRVRVWVEADELDELGMVIDFAELRRVVAEVLDPFDHQVINEIPPFDRGSTSAERLAEYVHQEVRSRLGDPRVRVAKVEVWESDGACAVYRKR